MAGRYQLLSQVRMCGELGLEHVSHPLDLDVVPVGPYVVVKESVGGQCAQPWIRRSDQPLGDRSVFRLAILIGVF
jgi:hypothetical protein